MEPSTICCGFCCEPKADISLCYSCFNQASKVITSMAKLEEFETVSSARSKKQPLFPSKVVIRSSPKPGETEQTGDSARFKKQQIEAASRGSDLLEPYVAFVTQYATAFTDQIHTDILLLPGLDDGPPIPAHKALMAAKSIVFENMFDSDICKAPSKKDEILTFPEMNHEELKTFLEFLYYGKLSTEEGVHEHASCLFSAARKYEIPFLEKFLEHELIRDLKVENALEILEIASNYSNNALKFAALRFIVNNSSIVNSPEFESFACKNASLAVEVSRDLATNLRKRPHPI